MTVPMLLLLVIVLMQPTPTHLHLQVAFDIDLTSGGDDVLEEEGVGTSIVDSNRGAFAALSLITDEVPIMLIVLSIFTAVQGVGVGFYVAAGWWLHNDKVEVTYLG